MTWPEDLLQGAGIVQWLQHCTGNRKVTGLSPSRSGRRIFFSGSTFSADSYFGIHSTPVLPQQHVKNLGHSAKSAGGRLQLNAHAPHVCGFAWHHVTWCVVVWCTQNALRQQQFHNAPARWQPNSTVSTPLLWIFKMRYTNYSHPFRSKCNKSAVSLLERRITLYIEAINNKESWFGLAEGVRLVSRRALAQFSFSSPLFKKAAVCGHCLVTLSLTFNETLKWLSLLPILMLESFWWWQCSNR